MLFSVVYIYIYIYIYIGRFCKFEALSSDPPLSFPLPLTMSYLLSQSWPTATFIFLSYVKGFITKRLRNHQFLVKFALQPLSATAFSSILLQNMRVNYDISGVCSKYTSCFIVICCCAAFVCHRVSHQPFLNYL